MTVDSGATAADWGRGFLELIPDLVCLCRDGVITYVNSAGEKLLDCSADEIVGRKISEFAHKDFVDVVEHGLEALAEETEPFPIMLKRLDGTTLQVELGARLLGSDSKGEAIVVQARNVTERTRAAEEMMLSEERYRNLVEEALDMICVCSGGQITYMNKAGAKILGRDDQTTFVGEDIADLVHADYKEIIELGLDVLAEEDGTLPFKLIRADGVGIDAEVTVRSFGRDDSYMMEVRDISEQKRSAEALRVREAKLKAIMDSVGEGIITASETGVIATFNQAAETIFGFSASEVIGKNLTELMPERIADGHAAHWIKSLASGQASALGNARELTGQRKDGSEFPLELNTTEVRVGTERMFTGVMRDITERKKAEETERRHKEELENKVEERTQDLKRLSRQNELILNSAGDAIMGVSGEGVITFSNPAAASILGWADSDLIGAAAADVLKLESGEPLSESDEANEGGLQRKDGEIFAAEYANRVMTDGGAAVGSVVVFRDITRRKQAEEKLRLAGTVFETTSEGIVVCDAEQIVTATNPAFTVVTGHESEAVFGQAPMFLAGDEESTAKIIEMFEHVSTKDDHWEGEMWSKRADGEKYAIRLSTSAIREKSGEVVQYVLLISDITERKRDEERIRYQANYDNLTGLPNRSLFHDRLNQAVLSASRGQQRVGLMFIDLDGFKAVNDTLGHDMGDYLLKEASKRIASCVREYDTVARLGGDEFTVVMPNIESSRDGAIVGQRILDSLAEPFVWEEKVGHVSGSIGISLFPEDAPDAETLLKNADAAMYSAKNNGKANYQFFTTDLNHEVNERQSIKDGLENALESNEFELLYQPRVDVKTGSVTGVEALLRWNNTEQGKIGPEGFIPVLEETGQMEEVGAWIMATASAQQVAWRKGGIKDVSVSVNLSVRQLRQADFAAKLKDIFDRTGADASKFEMEITEEMLIKDAESCITTLWDLRELGVKMAMDDFGTGYSSLTYLRRFPLDIIKVDNSYISGVANSTDDMEMVKTIINMGKGLGKRIVAEGVETEEQLSILRKLGCDDAQGFLFCPPMRGNELNLLLARGSWEKAVAG